MVPFLIISNKALFLLTPIVYYLYTHGIGKCANDTILAHPILFTLAVIVGAAPLSVYGTIKRSITMIL